MYIPKSTLDLFLAKYYLLERQIKFLVHLPGRLNCSHTPKVNFLFYGRHAGKTDFWKQANEASNKSDKKN